MATDAERLDWLEKMHTLHQRVEFTYVVDGYLLSICWDDAPMVEFDRATMREAIDVAMAQHPEVMRRYGDPWPKRNP